MRRSRLLVSLSVILLALMFRPLTAGTQELTTLNRDYFEGLFTKIVTAGAPLPEGDLVVTGFSVSPDTLTVSAGRLYHRVLNQVHGEYLGKKLLKVAMLVDGSEAGRVKMTGDLSLLNEVVVASENLGRNTVITEGSVRLEDKDITVIGTGYLQNIDDVVGKRLKTGIRAGEVIFSRLIEEPPVIKRGDLVTILSQSRGITVTVSGEAKNNGARGDLLRVKNLMSRKEITGRVIDEKTVMVEF